MVVNVPVKSAWLEKHVAVSSQQAAGLLAKQAALIVPEGNSHS